MKKSILFFITLFSLLTAFFSCRKEDEFTDSSSARLRFSTDTLFFDTIISQLGTNLPVSVTKQLWVVNPNAEGVRTTISVLGTANGSVKINVDGVPATAPVTKEIRGNDSIVIFVQLYSNASNNFIVADQILFETNGNRQDVDITGYGRDAYYHNNEVLTGPGGNIVWTNDKPHVIYDSVLVPKGQTLTIRQGTIVHSHRRSVLLVQGTLVIDGSASQPVVMRGDRLDKDYTDIAGQWIGIYLLSGSKDNVIKNAVIRDAVIGVRVDSASVNANPNLFISQSIIRNMNAFGIYGLSASIVAFNNLIFDCGLQTFIGVYGGNYTLFHNTFSSATDNAQFALDNSPVQDENGTVLFSFPLNASVKNNIIEGRKEEQLILNINPLGNQSGSLGFERNMIRTELEAFKGTSNILNQDPQFAEAVKMNYKLKASSPAKNKGVFSGITTDLQGNARNSEAPSIGAYE